MIIIPNVFNESGRGNDVFSHNLESRNILLIGEINDELSASVVSQLLYLDASEDAPIHLYINSPGGSITAGYAIYDTMKSLKNEVHTICMGQAASMAAVILSGGEMRYALEHSEVMIHQPSGGIDGQSSDIAIVAAHIEKVRNELNLILAKNCCKSAEEIRLITERDFWMSAKEACDFGIVDEIIEERKKKNERK